MDPISLLLASLVFTLLGSAVGIGTGLCPGIHVNNVALLVYVGQGSLAGMIAVLFSWASPSTLDVAVLLSVMILSIAVSHTFVSFVPSIFLGAPDEDTALSVLPGHRMLLRGRGYEAVLLTARGCLWGFVASLALVIPLRMIVGSPIYAYEKLRPAMAGVLALIVTLLVFSETERKKATGRFMLKANDVGGVQALSGGGTLDEIDPWPVFAAGEELSIGGKIGKLWDGGFLLVNGSDRVVVKSDDEFMSVGDWVRVQGLALPVTRTATSAEQRAWAILLFLMAGALGWILLSRPGIGNANWFPVPQLASPHSSMMLFPLFSGLFGLSTMLISGASRTSIPVQDVTPGEKMEDWRQGRAVMSGTIAGAAVSWFPGVSGASATAIAGYLAGGEPEGDNEGDGEREFLVSIGAANAASTVFTIVALFVILKGRSGAAATISSLLSGAFTPWEPLTALPLALSLLLLCCVVAAAISYLASMKIARLFARRCGNIRYGSLIRVVVVFILIMIFLLAGVLGILIAFAATAIGVVPPMVGVRRVHLMGALVLPAMILLAF